METKYFHIHVNYGGNANGFSAWLAMSNPVPDMIDADIIGHAVDSGLIEPDDIEYVDQVNEVTRKDYELAMANIQD